MNLELFGVPVHQVATYAGAALLAAVGGHEGLKRLSPFVAGVLARLRSKAAGHESAFTPPAGRVVFDLGDELGDAMAALMIASRYAKQQGNRAAVDNCMAALHDLMDPETPETEGTL